MRNRKGELALPWEKIIWWALLFVFAFFVLFFYGNLREMSIKIIKSLFK